MNPTMKSVEETHRNKNRVFDLSFSSKQVDKLDMLVNTLPKTFRQSEKGFSLAKFDERNYLFSVRGYSRANALIALFVTQMPRIKCIITTSYQDLNRKNQMKKKPTKKPSKKATAHYKIVGSPNTMSAFKQMLGYPIMDARK